MTAPSKTVRSMRADSVTSHADSSQPPALEHEIGEILMLMTRDFQHRLDSDLAARGVCGVGARHRSVFLYLGRNGPSRAVDLAHAAGIRPQSMMQAIHELEAMGLVIRSIDPLDSRAKLIQFSDAGERLIEELRISTEAVWRQYSALLSEHELSAAFTALKRLVASRSVTGPQAVASPPSPPQSTSRESS